MLWQLLPNWMAMIFPAFLAEASQFFFVVIKISEINPWQQMSRQ